MVQAQMRESVKVILVIILIVILPTITTSAQSKLVVRIGIYDNHPLVSLDSAGKPRGLFVDLVEELSYLENWDVQYVHGRFSENLQLLSDGKLDLIAAIAASEEREALYDFSAESGCILWGTVYVQPKSAIQSVLDLEGKSIAIVENGIYGVELRKLLSNFNITSSITETSSQVDSLRLLIERKVDAAVFNNAFKEPYGETEIRRTSIIFSPLKIGFAAPEGQNTDLLRAIDRAIENWKEDRDSFYYGSLHRWLGTIEVRRSFIPQWLTYVLLSTMAVIVVFVLWVVALRRQIALRKTAEGALQDSENRYRSLSDAASEGIAIIKDGIILDANKAMVAMHGYSRKDLVGMNAIDLVGPEDRDRTRERMLSEYELPYETTGLTKDGEVFPVEVHGKMFTHQGRQVRGVTVRNLTEQKRAEEEIRALHDILPICSICKNIRNDEGYYEKIEAYMHKHSGVDFTHTICPSCLEKHYPEQYERIMDKRR
jgi:PAS domain S-box-containing protein